MSCKNHLPDTDITPPSSPQSDTNNNSPPNYEDPSPLSSNYNVSQTLDDSRCDTSHYGDMQDNTLYLSPSQVTQSQPTTPIQIFRRVADSAHTLFPQSPRRHRTPLNRRRNSIPNTLRHLPHTTYHESQTRINFPPD